EEHCEIIGVVGKTDDFQFTSSEKMEIIPKDKILITDIFEYHTLHGYPNVKFLEPYSIGKKWRLYCLKAF
ncbi:MAG: hypothetical protein II135_10325, partial [Clostridia bacterium]|nr:hypothetical protein [Clostridia bacterium]